MIVLSVDMMSGDYGLSSTVPAVSKFLQQYPDVHLLLVGDESKIRQQMLSNNVAENRCEIIHCTEVVDMDEDPRHALKNKKDSSIRVCINQVKDGKAVAAISAGNTGALMAIAKFVLKTISGVQRPAIAKFLPTASDDTVCALDLGANVECTPEQLLQFSILGSQLVKEIYPQKTNPRIGLLNIGTEEIKGTENLQNSYKLLKESRINFIGNIESSDIFFDKADVIVCDGLIGNIALKAIEGSAKFMGGVIKSEFKHSLYSKMVALWAMPILKKFQKRLDPRRFNGAIFLGLRGIVVKSHGGTDDTGFFYALEEAYRGAKTDFLVSVEKDLTEKLQSNQ